MTEDTSLIWIGVAATGIGACITAGLSYLVEKSKQRHENRKIIKEIAIRLTEHATKNGIDPMVKLRNDTRYAEIYKTIESELNKE